MFSSFKWKLIVVLLSVAAITFLLWPKHDLVRVVEIGSPNTFIGIDENLDTEFFRLIGIEHNGNENEAKQELTDRLLEHQVMVEYGFIPFDWKGRKLVYVFTHPGKLLNSEIVESGLYKTRPKFPNLRYSIFI